MAGIDFEKVCRSFDDIEEMKLRAARLAANGKFSDARKVGSRMYHEALETRGYLSRGEVFHEADELVLRGYSRIFDGIVERSADTNRLLNILSKDYGPIERISAPLLPEIAKEIFRGNYDVAASLVDDMYAEMFEISRNADRGSAVRAQLTYFLESLSEMSQRIQNLKTDSRKIAREEA